MHKIFRTINIPLEKKKQIIYLLIDIKSYEIIYNNNL